MRGGRLRTIIYLNSREPRRWTPDEVSFMEAVASRTREVIARAEAEAALRDLAATLERRVAERTRERNLLATIVEETDAIVHVLDRDYRWLAFNRAGAAEFESLFGVRPKIGDSLLDRLSDWPGQRDAVIRLWSRAFAGEAFTTVDAFGATPDTSRTYEMKFSPLRDDQGACVGGFQIVTDISERIRAAIELERTQDALRQSQKMEAIGQLTGGVAHDFNNLLTVIRSSADLLQRPNVTEEKRRRYIEAIIDTSERAAKLTS